MLRNSSAMKMPRLQLDRLIHGGRRSRKAVLVALDGTAVAEQAIPVASMLAQHWKAALRLVYAREFGEDSQELDLCLVDDGKSLAVQSRPQAYLSSLAESLSGLHSSHVEGRTIRGTSAASALKSHSAKDARVLVMVRKRRRPLSRLWWGSVTNRLIGRLTVPLLLIPESGITVPITGVDGQSGFSRLLVYVDGNEASAAAVINNAAAIASAGAKSTVLRVMYLPGLLALGRRGVPQAFERRKEAWTGLFAARDALERHGIKSRPRLIFDGKSVGNTIVQQARATRAQIIVLAAGQQRLPWWLRDGAADYVVRHSDVPVLIVPADADVTSYVETDYVDIHSN